MTYYQSRPVSDWTANGDASTGHNFTEQIANQQGVIDTKQNEYNNYQGNIEAARNKYQDTYNNQSQYGDLYNQAKDSEGVNAAKEQYQKSLNAVNATQSAMNSLPSSINANSNRVLTSAQRQAALGNQMGKYQNTLAYWQNQNAGDQSMYQTALSSAQNLAGNQMAQQQANIENTMNAYQTEMNQANNLYNQLLQERAVMRQIYGDMYEDEYQHMQNELEIWAQNLNAETQRYVQDQQVNAQKYLLEQQQQQQKSYNDALARANDIDALNKAYAQYKSEVADLTKGKDNFSSYLFGENSLFPTFFNGGKTNVQRGQELQNKGFEDYLYNQNPYLQKILREDYGDLLSTYGIGA